LGQIVAAGGVIPATGRALTVTTLLAVAEHEPALVTVTEYVVVATGLTVMDAVFALLLQA
jgi:hypothetical protein